MPKNELNTSQINNLIERSIIASKDGYFLESAIISFQVVEQRLRLVIAVRATLLNVRKNIVDGCAYKEQSFPRLINYYGLLNPNNDLTQKLQKLNTKRNSLIHKIFYAFESKKQLEKELVNFIEEATKLNNFLITELQDLI